MAISVFTDYMNLTKLEFETYPQQRGKFRCFVDLYGPFNFLSDVPFSRHAHDPYYKYHYCCDDWSTIFNIKPYSMDGLQHYCATLESNNLSPVFGERVILFSTSSTIWDEPWGMNKANVFAFFRDAIYGVNPIVFEGHWKGNISYPLWDRIHSRVTNTTLPGNYSTEDFLSPTLYSEKEKKKYYGFYQAIEENPYDRFNWDILCDYLADHDEERFAEYIKNCLDIILINPLEIIVEQDVSLRNELFCDRIFKIYVVERLNSLRNRQINPKMFLQRKLKAVWTIEAQQDLLAIHGISSEEDAQQYLSRIIAEEIHVEMGN